jgi:hypothetical protein
VTASRDEYEGSERLHLATTADGDVTAVKSTAIAAEPALTEARAIERRAIEHAHAAAFGHAIRIGGAVVIATAGDATEAAGQISVDEAAMRAITIARARGPDVVVDVATVVPTARGAKQN